MDKIKMDEKSIIMRKIKKITTVMNDVEDQFEILLHCTMKKI